MKLVQKQNEEKKKRTEEAAGLAKMLMDRVVMK